MPVINFSYEYFNRVLGREINKDQLIDMLPMIGSDIEHYDDENIKVEFFPNRPDYYSVEGIARTVKGFLGIEEGIPDYSLSKSGIFGGKGILGTFEFDGITMLLVLIFKEEGTDF